MALSRRVLFNTLRFVYVTMLRQAFLQGHTDKVTCIAVSRDGRRLASGQAATLGQKAPVIVWDVEAAIRNKNTAVTEGEMLHQLVLHKGGVRDVAFSLDGDWLATLGGLDDNSLVIWSAETGAAVCGSPAASHAALPTWLTAPSSRRSATLPAGDRT